MVSDSGSNLGHFVQLYGTISLKIQLAAFSVLYQMQISVDPMQLTIHKIEMLFMLGKEIIIIITDSAYIVCVFPLLSN